MFDIQEHLKQLPAEPGVYLMKDKFDNIIYVGKAKILKNRVRQYFQYSKNHSEKVRVMVKHIAEFEYIVTDSEMEALILECNLIKKYKPKYNVLLRDDKTYPYIKVTTNEDFPRVLKVRKVIKDKAKYFGPYTNTTAVNDTLDIIKNIYPIRTCNIDIERAIKTNMRPCLNLHIKRCVGPCTGNVTKEEYNKMIEEIILFLSGKEEKLIDILEAESPNIIAITGDLIDSNHTNLEVALSFAQQAVKIAPCYFVTGNHEAWIGSQYEELKTSLQNTGITVLQDEAIELNYGDVCIQLIGLNDPDFSERDRLLSESILEVKLSQVNISDGFTILLSHRPEYFNVYQIKILT